MSRTARIAAVATLAILAALTWKSWVGLGDGPFRTTEPDRIWTATLRGGVA
jgi:hypothetical protein